MKSVAVEASFDHGKTWHKVAAHKVGGHWEAKVHATSAGTVSLRTTATDKKGDTGATTVIDAYGVR